VNVTKAFPEDFSELFSFITEDIGCSLGVCSSLAFLQALTGHQPGSSREWRAPQLAVDNHILNVLSLKHQLSHLLVLLLRILLSDFLQRKASAARCQPGQRVRLEAVVADPTVLMHRDVQVI
jgi:hypothetical protein